MALDMADTLIREGLAACVNIQDAVTSIYMWEGELEHASESLILAKTSAERYPDLQEAIRERHPYELPEIIAAPIQTGLSDYLTWVEKCTKISR